MSEWGNDFLTQRYVYERKLPSWGSSVNWHLLQDGWRPPTKVLMCEIMSSTNITADFWQWIEDKPNLLNCLAATQTETGAVLLFEHLAEGSLEDMLKTNRLGEWDLFHIMKDVLTALVGLLQSGKSVTDFKPQNIHLQKSFDDSYQFCAKLGYQGLHLLGVQPGSVIRTVKEGIFHFGAVYFYALTGKTVDTQSQGERLEFLKKMGVNPDTCELVCACLEYSQPDQTSIEWVSHQMESCLIKWIARRSETRRPSVDGSQILNNGPQKWTGKHEKRFSNGDIYWGDWLDGVIHGQGIYTWANGIRYEGLLEHGIPQDPKGVFIFPDGTRLQGNVQDGALQGNGKLTYSNGDCYTGNFKDDKFEGKGMLEMHSSGINYEGFFSNDRFEGQGRLFKKNKEIYVGEFSRGWFHQRGKLYYSDGDYYEGEYVYGSRHGRGVYHHSNSDRFEGDYKFGKRTGLGTFTSHRGSSYTGEFLKGRRHGKGKLLIPGILLYDGHYKEDKFHGQGLLRYTGGRYPSVSKPQFELLQPVDEEAIQEYDGEFSHGTRSGKGSLLYIDGSKYVGDFLQGLRHGRGELRPPEQTSPSMASPLCRSYKGEWEFDLPHGKGCLVVIEPTSVSSSDYGNSSRYHNISGKSTYDGTFQNGQATGEFEVLKSSGDRYLGFLKNGIPEGFGRMDYVTNCSYEGYWKSGLFEGKGTFTDPQGVTSDGYWKEGKREGEILNRWPDGKTFKGTYQRDKKLGKGVYTFPDGRIVEKFYNELDSATLG